MLRCAAPAGRGGGAESVQQSRRRSEHAQRPARVWLAALLRVPLKPACIFCCFTLGAFSYWNIKPLKHCVLYVFNHDVLIGGVVPCLQELSEEEVFQANTLGWCIELVRGGRASGCVFLGVTRVVVSVARVWWRWMGVDRGGWGRAVGSEGLGAGTHTRADAM